MRLKTTESYYKSAPLVVCHMRWLSPWALCWIAFVSKHIEDPTKQYGKGKSGLWDWKEKRCHRLVHELIVRGSKDPGGRNYSFVIGGGRKH